MVLHFFFLKNIQMESYIYVCVLYTYGIFLEKGVVGSYL